MIGGLILQECLLKDEVSKVTTIVRKASGIQHPKLVEVLHQDFMNYTAIEEHLKNQDVCFFCIGVYTGQVPAEEFSKITVDYTKAFAEVLKRNSDHTSFCFLSGAGADTSEKSRLLFARQKGIAENALLKLKFDSLHIFRPGYIYPDTPRVEPNLLYRVMRRIYKPLSFVYPNAGVRSTRLAHKMVEVGLNGGDKIYYENKDIRE